MIEDENINNKIIKFHESEPGVLFKSLPIHLQEKIRNKLIEVNAPRPKIGEIDILDLESGDYEFRYIVIDQIDLPPIWDIERYKDNYDKIKSTGKMPPVILSINKNNDRYDITDGIHRTNAAKKLGYTHVPSIVEVK